MQTFQHANHNVSICSRQLALMFFLSLLGKALQKIINSTPTTEEILNEENKVCNQMC